MNDILARRARRATLGIALSAALFAGIAPATAIAAEISSPTGAVALQTEDAATAKERAYAAMQEALKNLEAAKDAASPEKIAEIDTKIAIFQENYDTNLAQAAIYKESLPTMQANVDAAQAECDKAHNRTRALEAELNKIDYTTPAETIRQLQEAITEAIMQENSCEDKLEHCRMRLESHKSLIYFFESEVEFNKTHLDGETAKRDALLDDLKRAQTAYDDACKAYEEAKAAADKTASPEITQPTETTPPSNSTQPTETTQPTGSPATGKYAPSSSTKQANADGKLANTGDTTPSAIVLAGIAAAGFGITATATRRIKNSK
ncbi:LPXTG cell wall anchor domain-containing protein [Collinsella aerofaciens]|uniref:LPXTG cell wall anchor domain-containing protein n=5 Tax=Collinsella aerofaciens TaxID=74426 RepID=UPI00232F18CF|nr:LPXTG cell wall anchor domain-containing protein [Collinsella aerofaciens]MDB1867625.1 LPXTG cell wall anchor domain-containing protein [Collinsella aerofaciens]